MHAHTPTHNLWFWPKRPFSAFFVAETSVAEMSGPKRPRPKCPWPKCPSFDSPCLADEIAESRPDVNINVAAFTVSEKSINTSVN